MTISTARFRKLALSLEGATEVPHMDRAAFRTTKRIFATLAADGRSANLALDHEVQAAVCEARPDAFAPVPGGWGRMGYTTVDLGTVTEADLTRALTEAHARSLPPAKKKASAKTKTAATSKPRARGPKR